MTSASLINTNSIKFVFARRFLRTLSRIKRENKPSNLNSREEAAQTRKCIKKIKIAAYSSMARVVGPKVAWSRALLLRLRKRRRLKRNKMFSNKEKVIKKKKKKRANSRRAMGKRFGLESREEYNRLRKVVPGGVAMDPCSLINETAHYIQCLRAQVKVMQSIADGLSV